MEILYLITAVLLLACPEASAEAASVACTALKNVVVRSLFPMMVLSRLLARSSLSDSFCQRISRTRLWRVLRLSDALLPGVLAGIISGLPTAAVETEGLLREGKITPCEGAKALALASLPSPAFVILAASPSVAVGCLRYIMLLITAYITALCFRSEKSIGRGKSRQIAFSEAIASSAMAALSVSANIVFFSALTCSLSSVLPFARPILAVFFEMGSAVTLTEGNNWLRSAVVGWCGLSAMSQIKSAAPSLSVLPYAVTRGVSFVSLVILQYFVEFLEKTL